MNAVGKAGHIGLLIVLLTGFLARPPVADALNTGAGANSCSRVRPEDIRA